MEAALVPDPSDDHSLCHIWCTSKQRAKANAKSEVVFFLPVLLVPDWYPEDPDDRSAPSLIGHVP